MQTNDGPCTLHVPCAGLCSFPGTPALPAMALPPLPQPLPSFTPPPPTPLPHLHYHASLRTAAWLFIVGQAAPTYALITTTTCHLLPPAHLPPVYDARAARALSTTDCEEQRVALTSRAANACPPFCCCTAPSLRSRGASHMTLPLSCQKRMPTTTLLQRHALGEQNCTATTPCPLLQRYAATQAAV